MPHPQRYDDRDPALVRQRELCGTSPPGGHVPHDAAVIGTPDVSERVGLDGP